MNQKFEITFFPMRVRGKVPKGITILEAAKMLGVDIEGPCGGTGRCGKDLVQVRTQKTLTTVLACKTTIEDDLEVIVPSHEKKALKTVEGFYAEGDRKCDNNPSIRKEAVYNEQGLCFTKVYVNGELMSVEEGDTRSHTYGIALDIGTTTLVATLVNLNIGKILSSTSTLNPLVHYGHDVMSRIKYSTSQKDGLLRMHRELISTINFLINLLASELNVRKENIYQVTAAGNTTMQHIFLNKEIKGIGEYPYKAKTLDTCTATAKSLNIDIAEYAPITTFPCISAYVGGDIVSGLLAIDSEALELPALFLDIGTNGEMVLLLEDRMVATSTAAGPCFEGMTISSGMRASKGAIEHVHIGDEISTKVIGNGPPRGICGSGLLDVVSELKRVGLINHRGRLQSPDSGNNITQYSQNQLTIHNSSPSQGGDEEEVKTCEKKKFLQSNTITQQTSPKSSLSNCNSITEPPLSSPNLIPPIKGGEGGCKDTCAEKKSLHSDIIKYKKNLFEKDGKRYFRLADYVTISQEDIRQVQLAKAAIRAGIEILFTACNITEDDLKTVIIAGAFGYHLDKESLFRVGILPKLPSTNLSFVGNSSLEGAVRIILNRELMQNAIQIARNAQVVELSQYPGFEDIFVREMHF